MMGRLREVVARRTREEGRIRAGAQALAAAQHRVAGRAVAVRWLREAPRPTTVGVWGVNFRSAEGVPALRSNGTVQPGSFWGAHQLRDGGVAVATTNVRR